MSTEILLQKAVSNGDLNAVRSLLAEKVNVNVNGQDSNGWTPLQYAARWGDANIVYSMLAAGANVDEVGKMGLTALHLAASSDQVEEVVRTLLSAGAAVVGKESGHHGFNALYHVARHGYFDMLQLLIEADANVGEIDREYPIALWQQIKPMNKLVMHTLLAAGVDFDSNDLFQLP